MVMGLGWITGASNYLCAGKRPKQMAPLVIIHQP